MMDELWWCPRLYNVLQNLRVTSCELNKGHRMHCAHITREHICGPQVQIERRRRTLQKAT